MIYTGTLTVTGPTYNAIAYRYVFGDDTSLYSEGSGGEGAEGRRRYRYVTDTSTGSFDFALDAFRRNGTEGTGAEDTPWEYNPTGSFSAENNPFGFANAIPVGADDPLGLAVANEGPVETSTLAIGRVRPNPTAGQARVQVDAPVGSFVTVRVFDVTGRMVRTVVEDAPAACSTSTRRASRRDSTSSAPRRAVSSRRRASRWSARPTWRPGHPERGRLGRRLGPPEPAPVAVAGGRRFFSPTDAHASPSPRPAH